MNYGMLSYPGMAKKQISYGIKNIMDVPTYKIHTPKPALVAALHLIRAENGRVIQIQTTCTACNGIRNN